MEILVHESARTCFGELSVGDVFSPAIDRDKYYIKVGKVGCPGFNTFSLSDNSIFDVSYDFRVVKVKAKLVIEKGEC